MGDIPPTDAVPPPGALGSQLGALAIPTPYPAPQQEVAQSITQGAPGMTSMLNPVGTPVDATQYDPRRGASVNPNFRVPRLA
jgi:hypothetical protein